MEFVVVGEGDQLMICSVLICFVSFFGGANESQINSQLHSPNEKNEKDVFCCVVFC